MPDPAIPERADIVVAVTTHNDAPAIGGAVRAVCDALRRIPEQTSVIAVIDAASTDGTVQAAREAAGDQPLVATDAGAAPLAEVPYHGRPRRAAALRAALGEADRLQARASVVLDAALSRFEPAWIERLAAAPLSGEFHFASPFYARSAHEGAITKGIVYPMVRALYGVRLRQPAATEFGCTREFVTASLAEDFWDAEHASSGIDLWLTVAAAAGGLRCCEVSLGARGPARQPAADLSSTLAQVVGALFVDLEHRSDTWQRVRGSGALAVLGDAGPAGEAGASLSVDALVDSFRLGYRELREIWTYVLPPRTIVELRKLSAAGSPGLRFDDRLWADIVYDFAIGHAMRVMPRDHLVRSLTPLYSGWLASFILDTRGADAAVIDAHVERIAEAFEAEKRYFVSRWRWPERLR